MAQHLVLSISLNSSLFFHFVCLPQKYPYCVLNSVVSFPTDVEKGTEQKTGGVETEENIVCVGC